MLPNIRQPRSQSSHAPTKLQSLLQQQGEDLQKVRPWRRTEGEAMQVNAAFKSYKQTPTTATPACVVPCPPATRDSTPNHTPLGRRGEKKDELSLLEKILELVSEMKDHVTTTAERQTVEVLSQLLAQPAPRATADVGVQCTLPVGDSRVSLDECFSEDMSPKLERVMSLQADHLGLRKLPTSPEMTNGLDTPEELTLLRSVTALVGDSEGEELQRQKSRRRSSTKSHPNVSQVFFHALLGVEEAQRDLSRMCKAIVAGFHAIVPCATHCDVFTSVQEVGTLVNSFTGQSVNIGEAIVGSVAQSRAMLTLNSHDRVVGHPAYQAHVDAFGKQGAPSQVILIPMVWNRKLMGVVRLAIVETMADGVSFNSNHLYASACLAHAVAPLLALHTAEVQEMEFMVNLLNVVSDMAEDMLHGEKLAEKITESSKILLSAERCALFYVDEDSQTLVSRLEGRTVSIPINQGIAGFVAVSGRPQNIPNAYNDPRFCRDVDKKTGFHTRQILCMPLKCGGRTLAVAQLVNKMGTSQPFSSHDQAIFEVFSRFAGLAIRNHTIFQEAKNARDRMAVLLDLSRQLGAVTLDGDALKMQVIESARELVNADRGTLFVADWDSQQLVTQIDGKEITMPINAGIAGSVVLSGKILNIPDAYADPRFNKQVDQSTGYKTDTILATPVKFKEQVVAVAQLINKHPDSMEEGTRPVFTKDDEILLDSFGAMAGIAIRTAEHHRRELREKEKFRAMLDALAAMIQTDIRDNIESVCTVMVRNAQYLVGCEHARLYIIDKEKGILVSSGQSSNANEVKLRLGQGIAGEVAITGEVIRLKDPENTEEYEKALDEEVFGYRTSSILAMPVTCHSGGRGNTLAVVELVNKKLGEFTMEDETTLQFYCSLAAFFIKNARLFHFERQNETNLMALMHAPSSSLEGHIHFDITLSPRSKQLFAVSQTQTVSPKEAHLLQTPDFNIHLLKNDAGAPRLCALVVEMFTTLGLCEEFAIDQRRVLSFVIEVRKRYREVPYHNFYHAFDVTQTIYTYLCAIEKSESEGWVRLSKLDKLVLLLCGLCHDIDHMGLNNSFHYNTETPLGILSNATGSKSPLEVHHCNVMFSIMQQPSGAILSSLPHEDQTAAYKALIDCILSTDMALHQDICAEIKRLGKASTGHRAHTLGMIMLLKAADISNPSKPFEISKIWAGMVVEEFHRQGDVEVGTTGAVSNPVFDRHKNQEVAKTQVDFIQHVCEPYVNLVVQFWPQLAFAQKQLLSNKQQWIAVQHDSRTPSASPKTESL